MKHSVKSLTGYTMEATDGEIGSVREFYFDDETLTIRYLVVKTGYWLLGRNVLVPIEVVENTDSERMSFQVDLTKQELENSPHIDTEKPVSRQQEGKLYGHFGYPKYWSPGALSVGVWSLTGTVPLITQRVASHETGAIEDLNDDIHLHSTQELIGYKVHGIDGKVGEVEDFVVDDSTWKIIFLLIDPGDWLPGKKVLLSPQCIREISWSKSAVFVNMPANEIEDGPEYDLCKPVNVVRKSRLYGYYGTPEIEE